MELFFLRWNCALMLNWIVWNRTVPYIYIYIYICVCVCVTIQFSVSTVLMWKTVPFQIIQFSISTDAFDVVQSVSGKITVFFFRWRIWGFFADGFFVVVESQTEAGGCFPEINSVVVFSAENVYFVVAITRKIRRLDFNIVLAIVRKEHKTRYLQTK